MIQVTGKNRGVRIRDGQQQASGELRPNILDLAKGALNVGLLSCGLPVALHQASLPYEKYLELFTEIPRNTEKYSQC